MKKLKVFYISYNLIREWPEVEKIAVLSGTLEKLNLLGNPLAESTDEEIYRAEAIKRLPFLQRFDGDIVLNSDL